MGLNVLGYQLNPTYCNIAILPVVTKDISMSPRFSPMIVYRDVGSALLQLINQWLNFIYSRSHPFRYGRKNANSSLHKKNRTHDFSTTVVVVVVFTLKERSGLYPVPSLFYSSRQRNEFPWSQANPKYGTEKNKIKAQRKSQHSRKNM